MNGKEFALFGKTIFIQDDLKLELESYHALRMKCELCISHLAEMCESNTAPEDICNTLYNEHIKQDITEIIQKLASYGMYTKTIYDFVDADLFAQPLNLYHSNVDGIIRRANEIHRREIESAHDYSDSMVTGLPFNIYTSSLIAHGVYAAQEYAEVKRQTQSANQKFFELQQTANNRRTSIINSEKSKAYFSFCQVCKDILQKTYANIQDEYLNALESCGKYCRDYKKNMSLKQSTDLLSNLDVIEQKKEIIYHAVTLYPANADIYVQAVAHGIMTQELTEIIRYLHLELDISCAMAKLINTNRMTLCQIEQKYTPFFQFIAELLQIPFHESAKLYIPDTSKEICEKYESFCTNSMNGNFNKHIRQYNLGTILDNLDIDNNYESFVEECTISIDNLSAAIHLFGADLEVKLIQIVQNATQSECFSYRQIPQILAAATKPYISEFIAQENQLNQHSIELSNKRDVLCNHIEKCNKIILCSAISILIWIPISLGITLNEKNAVFVVGWFIASIAILVVAALIRLVIHTDIQNIKDDLQIIKEQNHK